MLTKHKYLLSTGVQLQIQGIPSMISSPKLHRREVEELRAGSKSLKQQQQQQKQTLRNSLRNRRWLGLG